MPGRVILGAAPTSHVYDDGTAYLELGTERTIAA
jgi:hypothetical protein